MIEDGRLETVWMKGQPAPQVVLEFMACTCSKSCKIPKCQCITNGFKCSPVCRLQTCENMPPEDHEDEMSMSDNDSDENE